MPDGDGLASVVASDELALPAGKTSRTLLYVKFGRLESSLKVAFHVDGQAVFSRTFAAGAEGSPLQRALPSAERLIVQLGASFGIEEALAQQRRDSPEHASLAVLSDAGELPTRWLGYESVDLVVLSAADEAAYAAFAQDPSARALEQWVELGGQLMLAPGSAAPQLLAEKSPLARLAPGKFAEFVSLRKTNSLESYTGISTRIDLKRSGGLAVAKLADGLGAAEVREGDLPLVLRAPHVFGRVTFVALDLARGPLAEWPGRTPFINRLLDGRPAARIAANKISAEFRRALGLTDLAGQLRGALDQFPGVELAPFWLVAGLIVVYLLLIGPGDFFLRTDA